MGFSFHWHFPLFFLCVIFSSGPSVAENPTLEAIQQNEMVSDQEKRILFSPSVFTSQLDDIPVINPSPTTATPTPIVNPTSPPAPTSPDSTITPTTPTTTPPTPTLPTTPTTPTTTPTTPPTTIPTTPPTTTTPTSGGSWCVASQTASETALQVALDYACGYGGADCSAIQPSGSCYNPNTLRDHASYAFNDYYHKNPAPTSCVFGGTAQLTNTDPSQGNCHYASSTSSTSPPPPSQMTPMTPMTPATPTTPSMATPSIYGSEPTATPSSAISFSYYTVFLSASTGILASIIAANYL